MIKICNELDCNLEDLVYVSHSVSELLDKLLQEKKMHLHGSLYHEIQILFTYNSNHIEGSLLNEDETRYIYETHTINGTHNTDDIIETINHFRCFDFMLDTIMQPLSEFHYKFESIHPFQDGNGRVGRMIMFRQCLKTKSYAFYYRRGTQALLLPRIKGI